MKAIIHHAAVTFNLSRIVPPGFDKDNIDIIAINRIVKGEM